VSAILTADGHRAQTQNPIPEPIPDDVKAFIVHRLADLPEESREVVREYQENDGRARDNNVSSFHILIPDNSHVFVRSCRSGELLEIKWLC
jgi:hypothetical protein